MTYRCGIGPGIPGMQEGAPHLRCDECGLVLEARASRGGPPAWLRENRPPKGWAMARLGDVRRLDICPHCVKKALSA